MKIAIIADIHHGSLSHTKEPGWDGLSHLRGFVERAIAEKADVILDLGDRFSDQTRETDYRDALELAPIFKAFPGPRVHILGNHDVSNLSIADNEEIFGQSMQSRVLDLGETRLIAWQPDVRLEKVVGFPKAEPHLQWLIDALNADQRPAIIASHVPVSGHSQIGNYYFERNAHYATYRDHAVVRRAVEATGKAAIWLSGHVHWNTITNVRNIQHITIQSASERFTTAPLTAATYADLEIRDGQFSIEVFGNDPFYARLPFRRSGDRQWLPPLEPFTEADRLREEQRHMLESLDTGASEAPTATP